ncbi:MAG: DUF1800 domain-containing protein [Candidatus Dormibacteraeota bacterium]|nr:DUF1800 domain-containing protein [Candidatus Dormibacteraeota bacterium]
MSPLISHLTRRQVLTGGAVAAAGAVGAGIGVFELLPRQTLATPRTSASGPDGAWPSPLGGQQGLAAHLLRRAGFGYTGSDLEAAASMPYEQLVEQVLHQSADSLPSISDAAAYQQVVRAWYTLMATTSSQFPERMTLFWHGVLTSDFRNAGKLPLVLQQLTTFRSAGRSDLRTLLLAATYDPLMGRYLNLAQSSAASPNENYSRELMELFTIGPGTYSEGDVREGARIFSGIRRGRLVSRLHDSGTKTYLGQTGNFDPEQAIDILLEQPMCATHVAQRALVQFCTPNPSNDLVNAVATEFRNSKYDITTLMRAIFTSADFVAAANYRSLVRQPAEYMVATMRALDRPDLATACVRSGVAMGQALYDPPNVGGWPPNQAWISSSAWLARLNFAARVVRSQRNFPDATQAVADQLDGVTGSDTTAALASSADSAGRWDVLLSSPEFQLK